MPKLPRQRGFYDDRRQFQGKDQLVPFAEEEAVVPRNLAVKSFAYAALCFLFIAACFWLRERQIEHDRTTPTGRGFSDYAATPKRGAH